VNYSLKLLMNEILLVLDFRTSQNFIACEELLSLNYKGRDIQKAKLFRELDINLLKASSRTHRF